MPQNTDMDFDQITNLGWIIEGKILLLNLTVNHNDPIPDQIIVVYMDCVKNVVDLIVQVPTLTTQGSPSLKKMTGFKHQQHPRLGYITNGAS